MVTTCWIGVCSQLLAVCDGASVAVDGVASVAPESTEEYIARIRSIRSFKLGGNTYERTSRDAPLGQGSFGVVFEAEQLPGRVPVAVKCALPTRKTVPGSMLAREVSITRWLNGLPWNLDLLDYESSPRSFECAAFRKGGIPVWNYFHDGSMTLCQMLDVVDRMPAILGDLHARGYAHMDPHAANWLLGDPTDLNTLKLIDFGMALPLPPPTDDDVPPPGVKVDLEELQYLVYTIIADSSKDKRFPPTLPIEDEPTSESIRSLTSLARPEECRGIVSPSESP